MLMCLANLDKFLAKIKRLEKLNNASNATIFARIVIFLVAGF